VPQIATYAVRGKGMEHKGVNHDASTGAAAVGEKAHLGTKRR